MVLYRVFCLYFCRHCFRSDRVLDRTWPPRTILADRVFDRQTRIGFVQEKRERALETSWVWNIPHKLSERRACVLVCPRSKKDGVGWRRRDRKRWFSGGRRAETFTQPRLLTSYNLICKVLGQIHPSSSYKNFIYKVENLRGFYTIRTL